MLSGARKVVLVRTKTPLVLLAIALSPLAVFAACTDAVTADPADSGALPTPTDTTPAPTTTPTGSAPEDAAKPDRAIAPDVRQRIEAYDTALAKAVCGKITTCCNDADRDLFAGQFKEAPYKNTTPLTNENCETVLKASYDALYLEKWGVSASVGNIVFDDAKGQACIAKVGAATCGTTLTSVLFDGACFGIRGNEVFRKVGALGAACDDIGDTTFIGECDPAQGYCNEKKKCTAWRKTGESCGILLNDAGPAERLFCAPGTNCDGQTLRNPGKCSGAARNVALGETCTAQTGPDLVCPAGSYCDVLGTGKCTLAKANGEACSADDECTSPRPFTCLAPRGDAGADASTARVCGSTAYCGGRQ